jgi:hypothetical protein
LANVTHNTTGDTMNNLSTANEVMRPEYATDLPSTAESPASGVSWGAVIGGAFVAASMALILTFLGVGLGLSSVSPWSGSGASATAIGAATIGWLIATQAIAAGLGGYLAGRLRTKWTNVHSDEIYFRDTAHGFLVWAVGVVVTATFLASAASSIVGTTAKVAAAGGGAAATAALGASGTPAIANIAAMPQSLAGSPNALPVAGGYLTDSLFRNDRAGPDAGQDLRPEVGRILAEAIRKGSLPVADRTYVAQVIAARNGMTQANAELRVDAVYTQAKSVAADAELAARNAADEARKAAAKASLWIFVALLIGAFVASVAAMVGGRQRDNLATIAR